MLLWAAGEETGGAPLPKPEAPSARSPPGAPASPGHSVPGRAGG